MSFHGHSLTVQNCNDRIFWNWKIIKNEGKLTEILSFLSFCAQSLQSCLTLCSPMDCSPLGSSVHGILQARILEWVAKPSPRGLSQPRDWTWVCCITGKLLLNQQGSPPFHSRCSHCQFRRCNRHGFDPCVGKIPGRRKMRPTSILAWKIPWTEEPGRLQSWLSDWACVHGIQAAMFIWRWQCEIWMTEFEWNQRARRENRIPTYQRLRVENTGECR